MGGRGKTVKHISDVKIILVSLRVKMVPVPFRFVLALELFIDSLGSGAGSQSVVLDLQQQHRLETYKCTFTGP